MTKQRSRRKYLVRDQETGRRFYTDRTFDEVVRNQEQLYAEVAPEDRHKLTLPQTYKRVWVVWWKPMGCTACGKSSDCAKIPGPGVRHSEVWICKKCWGTEIQQRRKAGNPDRLKPHPWPKKRRTRETRLFLDR